jgi:hypothetical protein
MAPELPKPDIRPQLREMLAWYEDVLGRMAEQVVQPGAERLKIVAQAVNCNVGLLQFVGRLLAGCEQQNQHSMELVVGGNVDSFLGDGALRDSRSESCSIRA